MRHSLVKKHPFKGQFALYAVSGSSFGIEGMADGPAFALLRKLAAHATQEQYCYTHNYDNGDVIDCGNASLMHRRPLIELTRPRSFYRVTVLYVK